MGAESTLQVLNPISSVLLVACYPEHNAVTVAFVVLPITFIVISCCVGHSAVTPFHTLLPITLVDRAVFITKLPVTVTHSIKPSSFVFYSFLVINISAVSMSKSIQNVSLVSASVRPSVVTLAGDFIFTEFAFVYSPVSPFKCTLAVEKAVSQLTFVFVAIFEDASALSMENLANLYINFSSILTLPVHFFRSQ